jgi:4'-phosphopantetheinyl transferase
VKQGEAHVWRVPLASDLTPAPPTAGELARAATFRSAPMRAQYLRSHAALRAILGRFTQARLDFAVTPSGKPYLPAAPQLQFNLSHSNALALVGVSLDVEIGVDVEHIRRLADYAAMADRFFPPSEAAEVDGEADFFRRWTRIEAAVKAHGLGIFGLGGEITGEWTIEEIDVGPEYAAAVALPRIGIAVVTHDFGGDG